MNWIFYSVLIISILVIFLLLLKVKVTINIELEEQKQNIDLNVTTFFGLIKYKYKLPYLNLDLEEQKVVVENEIKNKNTKNDLKDTKKKITFKNVIATIKRTHQFLQHVSNLYRIVRRFFSTIRIHELQWHTVFGTGDAANTGTLTGVLWAVKANFLNLINELMQIKKNPEVSVHPVFQGKVLKSHFHCIISFRIGNAILAGLRIISHWKRITKGGRQHVRASNSRLNDHSNGKLEAND